MVQKSSGTFNAAAAAHQTPAKKLDAAPIEYQDFLRSLDHALTAFENGPLSTDQVIKNLNGAKTPAERAVWDKAASTLAIYGGNSLDKGHFVTFLVKDGAKQFSKMAGQAVDMPDGTVIDRTLFDQLHPAQEVASKILHNHFKITDPNNDFATHLGMEAIQVQIQSMADKAADTAAPIIMPASNPGTQPYQHHKF